jgi:hypothetical protein
LSESLTLGNVNGLVDLCIKEKRFTEAILIANCFDDKSLLAKAQRIFFKNNESKFSKVFHSLSFILTYTTVELKIFFIFLKAFGKSIKQRLAKNSRKFEFRPLERDTISFDYLY